MLDIMPVANLRSTVLIVRQYTASHCSQDPGLPSIAIRQRAHENSHYATVEQESCDCSQESVGLSSL
jgi:hypothetical protein